MTATCGTYYDAHYLQRVLYRDLTRYTASNEAATINSSIVTANTKYMAPLKLAVHA